MKPESIRRVEFQKKLLEIINESGLPPYVVEPILLDTYRQFRAMTAKQYQADLVQWEKQQKEEKDAIKDSQDKS